MAERKLIYADDAIRWITIECNPYGKPTLDSKSGKKVIEYLERLPSAQPDGWLARHRDEILKAGMEGREVEFRIGGRLFAIREKAQ